MCVLFVCFIIRVFMFSTTLTQNCFYFCGERMIRNGREMRKWIRLIQEDFLGEKTMSSRIKWDENKVYKAGKGIDSLRE